MLIIDMKNKLSYMISLHFHAIMNDFMTPKRGIQNWTKNSTKLVCPLSVHL